MKSARVAAAVVVKPFAKLVKVSFFNFQKLKAVFYTASVRPRDRKLAKYES